MSPENANLAHQLPRFDYYEHLHSTKDLGTIQWAYRNMTKVLMNFARYVSNYHPKKLPILYECRGDPKYEHYIGCIV